MNPAERKNLIVGTGPSAIAAAMAFRRLGIAFEVLDVGFDLEPDRESSVQALAAVDPAKWPQDAVSQLFPPPVTSAAGVEKRFTFGSNFPYRRPDYLALTTEGCVVDVSHGHGGFGNVWGAATLPYSKHDLEGWPGNSGELAESYRNVSAFVPSSVENDGLAETFPIYSKFSPPLARSEQAESLLRALSSRHKELSSSGIQFGRARVAVDTSGGDLTCRYCGACLDGCVYGSIFNPRQLWKKLEQEGVKIHRGFYALEFQENADGVTLAAISLKDGTVHHWDTRRLFIGAGAIGTTRLVARSLKLINQPIKIQDSQYFFFPLLAYRAARDTVSRFTLAEVFVEMLNSEISRNYVHFQVYGLNDIFRQTLRQMVPVPLRGGSLLGPVEKRFYLFQGFLHSRDSGHLEMTISASGPTKDEVHIRGVDNPRSVGVAKRAQSLLRRRLASFGFIPWLYLKMVPLGRSFHAGGSFPVGNNHPVFTSDPVGRPARLHRVHLLDATTFPSIPATTITYTAMANADRVISECHRQGYLE